MAYEAVRRLIEGDADCRCGNFNIDSETVTALQDLLARTTALETLLAAFGARDQRLVAILAAFQDEDDPDQCEDCHELVLCNFHTLLSMLHGRTEPTP